MGSDNRQGLPVLVKVIIDSIWVAAESRVGRMFAVGARCKYGELNLQLTGDTAMQKEIASYQVFGGKQA